MIYSPNQVRLNLKDVLDNALSGESVYIIRRGIKYRVSVDKKSLEEYKQLKGDIDELSRQTPE